MRGREGIVYCVAMPETRGANQTYPCIPERIRGEQVTVSITYRIVVGPQGIHIADADGRRAFPAYDRE